MERDYTSIFLADREEYHVKSYEEFWKNGVLYFKAQLRDTGASQPDAFLEGPVSSVFAVLYEVHEPTRED